MTKYLDPFLEHRRAQEKTHRERVGDSGDPMISLVSVEMNITELCNRTCVFCPRVDPKIYPNRNLSMDLAVSQKVADDLASFGYTGRLSFSGYGESLLNNAFEEHIRIFRTTLPASAIETNTNGDKLTVERARSLFEAGLSAIYVNLYDGPEQTEEFIKLFAEAGIGEDKYKLRAHWEGAAEDFGLTLNNRAGVLENPDIGLGPLEEPLENGCYYPFYKMFVDWNGDVLFCANDWGREIVVGNVMKSDLRDIWLSGQMAEIRLMLATEERSISPCNKCNVHGMLHGKLSFDTLMDHYTADRAPDDAESKVGAPAAGGD